MISAIAPTVKTVTPAPRVVMTNEEVDAYMASEMISQFGGMYISNKPETQVSLATTDSSVTNKVEATTNNHQHPKPKQEQGEDLTSSRQVATSESIAASLAIIAKGDQFEDDMMTTGADLFGVADDGNASSDDTAEQTTKKTFSTTVVPSKRNNRLESSLTEITCGVDHLTLICNAMEEDEDEMEVDLPEPEEDDVWMAEPWEIMEVDDPDEKDIDWMELL